MSRSRSRNATKFGGEGFPARSKITGATAALELCGPTRVESDAASPRGQESHLREWGGKNRALAFPYFALLRQRAQLRAFVEARAGDDIQVVAESFATRGGASDHALILGRSAQQSMQQTTHCRLHSI